METQAITARLPVDLYEKLRLEAFEKRTSMIAIITEALAQRYGMASGDASGGTEERQS